MTEHNLDPAAIVGTGPGGRITKGDAMKAVEPKSESVVPDRTVHAPVSVAVPSTATNDRQRRVALSNLRKRIGENLVYSRQNAAHVTTFNEIDMSRVVEIRTRYRESFQEKHGVKLGFMSFFVKAS